MIQFIDDHRDRFGVEPICRVLTEHQVKIAPSGYYAFKSRPVSARATSDAQLVVTPRQVVNAGDGGFVSDSAVGSVVIVVVDPVLVGSCSCFV